MAFRHQRGEYHPAAAGRRNGWEFEYVPLIRSRENENYEAVKRVLDGDRTGVIQLRQEPGMLVLFKGHHLLHRVAPGQGFATPLPDHIGAQHPARSHRVEPVEHLHYGPRVALIPA